MRTINLKLHCILMVLLMSTITSIAQRQFFDKNNDFLLANFDLKPDEDDVHSAAALASMLRHPDLAGVDYHAVAGAYGRQNGTFITAAVPGLYTMLFGAKNQFWSDLHNERNATINRVKAKVIQVLRAGNKVFVQEAGQSDFTYDIFKAVADENNGINAAMIKQNVIVVQHSWNPNGGLDYNERQTTPFKLTWVKANTDYEQIANGNVANNGTPGYKNNSKNWLTRAKRANNPNTAARDIWREADKVCDNFKSSYENPTITVQGGVDYSDCAEIWWIFNIGNAANTIEKFWQRYVENTNSSQSPNPGNGGGTTTPPTNGGGSTPCADKTFEEKNGVVAVEAEDFVRQTKTTKREWFILPQANTPKPDPDGSHAASASGGKYLELLPDTRVTHSDPLIAGTNFTNVPGQIAVIDYKIKFNSPGKYFVWVRAWAPGPEDNGVHVGINGTWPASGQRMQWCGSGAKWAWDSKQRTNANHCGVPQLIFLNVPSAGVHTISFSMREDGFEMDKFIMSKAYTKPTGNGAAPVAVACNGGGGNPTTPPAGGNTRPAANLANGTYFIQDPAGTTRINSPSGRTINKANTSNNSAKWVFTKVGNYYTIKNVRNNEFLEVPYGACNQNDKPQNPNINLGTWTEASANHLRWNITKVGANYFLQPLHCNKVIDRNNANAMHLWPYAAGNNNQTWRIVSASGTTPPPPPPATGTACNSSATITGLTATAASNTSINLSFNTFSGTNTYEVRTFTAGTFANSLTGAIDYDSGTTSPITVTGLTAGTSYTFAIRAICAGGAGASTLVSVNGTTSGGVTPPPPPPATGGGNNSNWVEVGGAAQNISVDNAGKAWVVNGAGQMYARTGNSWKFIRANVEDTGAGTIVSITNKNKSIASKSNNTANNSFGNLPGTSVKVDVDNLNRTWVVNSVNDIYRRDGTKWTKIAGKAIDIGCSGTSGAVFCIDPAGNVLRFVNGNWTATGGSGSVRIDVDKQGRAWVVTTNGTLYRYNSNNNWSNIRGGANDVGCGSDGSVWITATNTKIYKLTAAAKVLNTSIGIEINTNPVANGTLELSGANDASYSINGLTGSVVSTGIVTDNSIDVSSLSAGIYIIQFEKDGKLQIEKIVIN